MGDKKGYVLCIVDSEKKYKKMSGEKIHTEWNLDTAEKIVADYLHFINTKEKWLNLVVATDTGEKFTDFIVKLLDQCNLRHEDTLKIAKAFKSDLVKMHGEKNGQFEEVLKHAENTMKLIKIFCG